MEFIRKNKLFLILVVIAIIFFFIYSYLPISQLIWQSQNKVSGLSLKFNTPDEVINYYFSQQYAETGELYYFEPLDNFMQRVIFPRWAYVIDGRITPGNFMGIDLIYGGIGKIFSPEYSGFVIPFLTPLFAVLGVLFFYLLIKHFFDKKVAFFSALLVFIFPGFWYYASRTMFHNVLFLSLLIMGLYFLIKLSENCSRLVSSPADHADPSVRTPRVNSKKIFLAILTGLFFGLAMITRTSEVVWVFLLVLTVLMVNLKKIKYTWLYLLISFIIFAACFIPVLYHNKILYNNYFSTGYNLNTMTENLESGQVGKLNFIKAIFLPFGFHPRVIITHVFYRYILKLFWPWLILWLAGLIIFLKSKKTREQKMYLILLLIVDCLLLIVYGSWFFRDALDPNLISLGSSYVRYFLPMFIFSLPLIGCLFVKLWEKKIFWKCFCVFVFLCFCTYSTYQTLYKGPESLTATKNQLIKYNTQAIDLLKYIDEDAIILMDTGTDKVLFPERKHLIVPQDGVEWPEIQKILNYREVYYFHHTESVDKDYLNQIKFNPYNLELDNEILINGGGKLFQVVILKESR